MQALDVISVNLWNVLISLGNLLILYLFLKKFLYKPVQKLIEDRNAAIANQFAAAETAENNARKDEAAWKEKMSGAKKTADSMIADAARKAEARGAEIISQANDRADSIVAQAQVQAAQEMKKAEAQIRQEIVDISSLMTEKILEREINTADHKGLIDSMIDKIGEE